MFKQISIACIIFCVSILILTCTIVPHHHHEGLPCFTIETVFEHLSLANHHQDCTDHKSCCEHQQHHHESDAGSSEDTCVLDQFEFITTISQKSAHVCSACLHSHGNLLQAILIIYNYNFSLSGIERQKLRQRPYLANYHSAFVSQNLGLRAPPIGWLI